MRRRFIQLVAACGAFLTGLFRALPALAYDGTIAGNFAGVVPVGQHWHITGNVNLTGDLIVEGLLTGVDTFTLTGNGFQVLVQNGGVCDLAGKVKSGWVNWGDNVSGGIGQSDWVIGDRLAVAPTAVGVFVPTVVIWQGSWAATTRPANSADVTLVDGSVAKPEVANLTRTVTMTGLRRFHLHDGAGVQSLRHLAIVNSGTTGVLGDYPLHFHLCGETVRGSTVEGVVVEGGKNHAFVPHGSHGITFRDTVAYNTLSGEAYWWDPPVAIPPNPIKLHTANNSNDLTFEHVLGMWSPGPINAYRMAGFVLGAGHGNSVVDSVMTCVNGGVSSAGWNWPESANQNIGGTVWVFQRNVGHNNKHSGVFVWQNDSSLHVVEDFKAYRNGTYQIDHGAYQNDYDYKRLVLMGGSHGFQLHATGDVLLEDIISDKPLLVTKHNADATVFTVVRRCTFPTVTYSELGLTKKSWIRYEDCGLVPAKFNLAGIIPSSLIEIFESGVLVHRWANGVWV